MSDVSVDIIKNRSGEAPDLPSGANLSGVSTAATLQVTNLNPTHINASGVTTATTFSGSLKSTGTPTLGLGVTINSSGLNISGVATAGIVSATTLYGDGSNMTGVAISIAPVSYNPDVSDSLVVTSTGIGLTFTERIIAGSGNITIRETNGSGTVVENFGVGSSVTIDNNSVSFTPTSALTAGQVYHINYPSGSFTNTSGDVSYVGTAYTFVVKPNVYELWAWGQNTYGKLGNNNETTYSSPIQIPGTTWGPNVASGTNNGMATKTDGTLWSWGINQHGELGINNRTYYSSPVQIPGTTWKDVKCADYHALATKTDGTMWVWGFNYDGTLGQNQAPGNLARVSSPVQVGSETDWNKIPDAGGALGQFHGMASNTSGELWMWGNNQYGPLGDGSQTDRSMPVQIPGNTWGTSLSTGYLSAAATKRDGTLWTWGRNNYGQLGVNNTTSYSSPKQVPGTTWEYISKGAGMVHALKLIP